MFVNLVLRKNVPKLGAVGDVVKVTKGYARNYLIPQGFAYPVTPDNLKRLEAEKKRIAREIQAEKDRCLSLAAELKNKSFTIPMKATEEGHLYGSVDSSSIAAAITADGLEVDEKAVEIPEPIKELGIYEIAVKLHPGVTAKTKVWIVSEEGREKEPGEEKEEAASEQA